MIDDLRAEIAHLRYMQTRLSVDLVRVGLVSLFMPINDNLYNSFVSPECKGLTIDKHRELSAAQRPPSLQNMRTDVTKLMLLYTDTLYRAGLGVHVVDVGAWVGDNAVQLARFAKLIGGPFRAECYDPSFAGALIPLNIELNGVADMVGYHPLGISLTGGMQHFRQIAGHTDSARLGSIGRYEGIGSGEDNYIIRTVTLGECLSPPHHFGHLIVLIDLDGIDADVVRQNRAALADATIVVEFAPDQKQHTENGAGEFIRMLQETHTLFDVYYLPRPTRGEIVGDPSNFAEVVRFRPWGYTDVLAVPHSLRVHDELKSTLSALAPIEPAYRIA